MQIPVVYLLISFGGGRFLRQFRPAGNDSAVIDVYSLTHGYGK